MCDDKVTLIRWPTRANARHIQKHAANTEAYKKTNAKRKRCISSHTTEVLQASRGGAELLPERQRTDVSSYGMEQMRE